MYSLLGLLNNRVISLLLGTALLGIISGVLLLRKNLKEQSYKKAVVKQTQTYADCIMSADNNEQIQACERAVKK